MSTDIVVTGVSTMSACGTNSAEFWSKLSNDELGIAQRNESGLSGMRIPEINYSKYLTQKGLQFVDRCTKNIMWSLAQELEPEIRKLAQPHQCGLSLGTAFGSLNSTYGYFYDSRVKGPDKINPMNFGNTVFNSPVSHCNILFGLSSLSITICSGFTSALNAIIYGVDYIKGGKGTAVLAGGSEELSMQWFNGFRTSGLLIEDSHLAPYHSENDGTIIGEGVGMLLLESRQEALARGAHILAQVVGAGSCFNGSNFLYTDNSTAGLVSTMQDALKQAEIAPQEISYIMTGANGIQHGDQMELQAISEVFANEVFVTAPKKHFGECYGASAALSAVAAVLSLQNNTSLYSQRLHEGRLDCDLRMLKDIEYIMINAYGYGGYATIILKKQ